MRVYVRDHMGYIEDRLLTLADRLEDKVTNFCPSQLILQIKIL